MEKDDNSMPRPIGTFLWSLVIVAPACLFWLLTKDTWASVALVGSRLAYEAISDVTATLRHSKDYEALEGRIESTEAIFEEEIKKLRAKLDTMSGWK